MSTFAARSALILAALDELRCPATAEAILRTARARAPKTGAATVYRALRQLVEQGRVAEIPRHTEVALYMRTPSVLS